MFYIISICICVLYVPIKCIYNIYIDYILSPIVSISFPYFWYAVPPLLLFLSRSLSSSSFLLLFFLDISYLSSLPLSLSLSFSLSRPGSVHVRYRHGGLASRSCWPARLHPASRDRLEGAAVSAASPLRMAVSAAWEWP